MPRVFCKWCRLGRYKQLAVQPYLAMQSRTRCIVDVVCALCNACDSFAVTSVIVVCFKWHADLPQIRLLNISRTSVGDQGLRWLQECPHLQDLIVAPRSNNLWTDCAWSEAALSSFATARPDVHIQQSWDL